MCERGLRRIVIAAARQQGYRLEASRLHHLPSDVDLVRFRIDPDGPASVITASYEGFDASFPVGQGGVLPTVEAIVGHPPQEIRILDRGRLSDELESTAGHSAKTPVRRAPYRERVF